MIEYGDDMEQVRFYKRMEGYKVQTLNSKVRF